MIVKKFPYINSNVFIIGITALIIALLMLFAVSTIYPQYFLTVLGVASLLILIFPLFFRKRYDIFEPLSFTILGVLTTTTLSSFYIALNNKNNELISSHLIGRDIDFVIFGGLVGLLGLFCFQVGYLAFSHKFINLGRLALFKKRRWSKPRMIIVLMIFLAFGSWCLFIYIKQMGIVFTGISSFSSKRFLEIDGLNAQYTSLGYLRWGAELLKTGFYILFAFFAGTKRKPLSGKSGLLLLFGLILVSFFPILNSQRGQVLITFIYLLVIWHYTRSRVSIKKVVVLAFIMIFIFTVLSGMRKNLEDTLAIRSSFNINKILNIVCVSRMTQIAGIIDGVPEKLDFQYGKTYLLWLVAPIPRSIWKEKPIISVGGLTGSKLYQYRGRRGGISPGFIGELYWNFGWLGIFLGMFMMGAFLKVLYNSFKPYLTSNRNALLIYLFIMIPLAGLPGNFSGIVIKILKAVIPLLLILYFISSKKNKSVI